MKNDWTTALDEILNDYQNHQGTRATAHAEAEGQLEKLVTRENKEAYKRGYIAGGIAVAVSYRDHVTNEEIAKIELKVHKWEA